MQSTCHPQLQWRDDCKGNLVVIMTGGHPKLHIEGKGPSQKEALIDLCEAIVQGLTATQVI